MKKGEAGFDYMMVVTLSRPNMFRCVKWGGKILYSMMG